MNRRSLRFQMGMVLLGMIVIIALFGQILYVYFEQQYSSRLLDMNADVTVQLADEIDRKYSALEDALQSFSVDTVVNRFLSTDSEYEKLTLMPMYESLLQSYKQMNPSLYSIVLKKKDGSIFSDPVGGSGINIADTAPAFTALEEGAPSVLILSRGSAYIALRREIFQTGEIRKRVGSCMFVISADTLVGHLAFLEAPGRTVLVIDGERRLIAGNGGYQAGERLPTEYEAYLPQGIQDEQQIRDPEYIAVSMDVEQAGLTVLCLTARDMVFSELNGIRLTTYLLMAAMLLLIAVVYLLQSWSLSRAFRRFLNHIDAIASGRKVAPLKLDSSREFQQLADAFNRMMTQLDELNAQKMEYHEQLLKQELENKQSQLLALQSQINPHFLYNTLECINSAGAVCGSREVEEMSTALAFIFRYAIKGGTIVSLAEEMEALAYYVRIQQIRFPDMFTVVCEIEEDVQAMRLLKFLLQPIAENCILHGFRNRRGAYVLHIGAVREENTLLVTVRDNGDGIPEAELQRLRARLADPEHDTESIGLMNIQRRIRLYYGRAFGLEVESHPDEGTTVRVRLPVLSASDREGEERV